MSVLMIVAAMVALAWTAIAAKIISSARAIRFLPPFEGEISADLPAVDAIVPAHNEEKDIEATVRGIVAQEYPNLRATVVDDRSSDGTLAILGRLAEELPIRVISGVERPSGWVGKTWAIDQGLASVSADWILFVDADMGLHPRALVSAMKQAEASGADLVSIVARPEIKTFWQAAIAMAVGEVLFALYPLHKVNNPAYPQALAAGGFILVRRSVYETAGGHRAVRAEIAEDLLLAKTIKLAGGKLSVHLAPDMVTTHMYGTFGDLWRGLRKNAYAGMEYRFHKFVVGAIMAVTLSWVPIAATILGAATHSWALAIAGALGWLAQIASVAPSVVFMRITPLAVFCFPFGATAYTAIACSSVWNHHRGRILWKDVTFVAKEVEAGTRLGEAARSKPR